MFRSGRTTSNCAFRRVLLVAEISEILAAGDATDYGQLEPVPSAFYDDLDERTTRQAA